MSTSTRRPYRVSRYSGGNTSWGPWTHTYHHDLRSAMEAANRFLMGAGRYAGVNIGHMARGNHRAEVAQRAGADWHPMGEMRKGPDGQTYWTAQ